MEAWLGKDGTALQWCLNIRPHYASCQLAMSLTMQETICWLELYQESAEALQQSCPTEATGQVKERQAMPAVEPCQGRRQRSVAPPGRGEPAALEAAAAVPTALRT